MPITHGSTKTEVLQAVRVNGLALRYASAKLKANRELVMVAVEQNGWALLCASAALQDDPDVVMTAVKQNGFALQYASATLKNKKDIVMAAVQQNGYALQFVSAALRNDRDIVVAAVAQNRIALRYTLLYLQPEDRVREIAAYIRRIIQRAQRAYSLNYTFIQTILFGAKANPPEKLNPRDNISNVLSLLAPSMRLPQGLSINIKRKIGEFIGIPFKDLSNKSFKEQYKNARQAAINLGMDTFALSMDITGQPISRTNNNPSRNTGNTMHIAGGTPSLGTAPNRPHHG